MSNNIVKKSLSFIDLYLMYHKMRSSSDIEFGRHLIIQNIGHSLGRDSFNKMRPRAVRHNTFLCLLGQSGKSMKTTAQEDISSSIIPNKYRGTKNFSPEGLLSLLEEKTNVNCPLGEFSTVLRSIKSGGHMGNFKEISNDLWNCPPIYDKRLKNKEDSYLVKYGYLSMSTTCTVEEFFVNITPDMVSGGFLPRWILVYGPPQKKSREPLPENVDKVENLLLVILNEMYKYFFRKPVKFELTPSAYDVYYDIVDKLEDENGDWNEVQPFVARYQRYIIGYADILKISDLVGDLLEQEYGLTEIIKINKINEITKITEIKNRILAILSSKFSIYVSPVISIDEHYIKRAWNILKPCLEYAKKISNYVDEDFYIAKVKTQLEKFGNKVQWTKLLQYSKLQSDKFKKVIETLELRGEIQVKIEETGEGRSKKQTQYIVKTRGYK